MNYRYLDLKKLQMEIKSLIIKTVITATEIVFLGGFSIEFGNIVKVYTFPIFSNPPKWWIKLIRFRLCYA